MKIFVHNLLNFFGNTKFRTQNYYTGRKHILADLSGQFVVKVECLDAAYKSFEFLFNHQKDAKALAFACDGLIKQNAVRYNLFL